MELLQLCLCDAAQRNAEKFRVFGFRSVTGLSVDGVLGPETAAMLQQYQLQHEDLAVEMGSPERGLCCGPLTWQKLLDQSFADWPAVGWARCDAMPHALSTAAPTPSTAAYQTMVWNHRHGPWLPPTAEWLHAFWLGLVAKLYYYLNLSAAPQLGIGSGEGNINSSAPVARFEIATRQFFAQASAALLPGARQDGMFAICLILDSASSGEFVRPARLVIEEREQQQRLMQQAERRVGGPQSVKNAPPLASKAATNEMVAKDAASPPPWHNFMCMGVEGQEQVQDPSRASSDAVELSGMENWPLIACFPRHDAAVKAAVLAWHRPNIFSLLMERQRMLLLAREHAEAASTASKGAAKGKQKWEQQGSQHAAGNVADTPPPACYSLEWHYEPRGQCEPPGGHTATHGGTDHSLSAASTSTSDLPVNDPTSEIDRQVTVGCTYWLIGVDECVTLVGISRGPSGVARGLAGTQHAAARRQPRAMSGNAATAGPLGEALLQFVRQLWLIPEARMLHGLV